MIFQEESVDKDTEPSNSFDAELKMRPSGKRYPSPLTIQGEERADRRQACHSHEESLLFSLFSHTRTGRPVHELCPCERKSSREMEKERIRILFERPELRTEIQKHEFQADYDRRSVQKLNENLQSFKDTSSRPILVEETFRNWMELSSLSEEKLIILLQVMNNIDEINNFCMNNYRDLREAHMKSLHEMEVLKRFQGSTFDTIGRRKLVEDRDTILEFTGTSERSWLSAWFERFQDAESVLSVLSHVTSQPVFFPLVRDPGGMPSRSGMQSRNDKPPDNWDTHGTSSSALNRGGFNPWTSNVTKHISPHVASARQTPDTALDPRCQSGTSARNSFVPSEGRSSKNYGADQQRLQISDPHFDKFTTSATFACWKIRLKTEVCICSQFPTEAMLWIKEVDLVESVDDLKSSRSVRGTLGPDFELFDARNASALNRIIQKTQSKRQGQSGGTKGQQEDPFLRGRQIVYLIYENFRVTGANDSVKNCADLFTFSLQNDDIQEFDSKWDGILLSMTKIPPDDILEGLYKLRTRQSEKLKTVVELYNMEIHQKKIGPDHHRFKTMVKRSVEQDIPNKNFESWNGNFEKNAVVKNQGTKQREQRTLGDCLQWKANWQCSKRRELQFPSRYQISVQNGHSWQNEGNASKTRSPRGRSPSGKMSRWPCKDYLQRNLHHSFLQVRKCMQISGKVLLCAPSGWRTLKITRQLGCGLAGYGAAEVFTDLAEELKHTEATHVFDSRKPCYVMVTFETRIHCWEWFAQVILISVTPMLQNLRIGPRKRQNGKSKVPAKQRGSWPKMCFNSRSKKEQ